MNKINKIKLISLNEVIKKHYNTPEKRKQLESVKRELKKEIDLELQKELAYKIRKARLEAFLSQELLARKIGTTKTAISRIEAGKQNITIQYAAKIAKATNKKLKWEFI